MVLYDYQIKGFFKEFSPPYGDGTESGKPTAYKKMFSPPYGDGTRHKHTAMEVQDVFAPLRGWYLWRY